MSGKQQEWEELRINLEGRLADAENLNNNLRAELDKAKAESVNGDQSLQERLRQQEDQLRAQQDEIEQLRNRSRRSSGGGDSDQYQELLREHEELKQELREQEEVRLAFL
jgi:hypothetical protein